MLRVHHDTKARELRFPFDMPVPKKCLEHPEFASFLTAFTGCGGTAQHGEDGALLSLAIPVAQWRDFIERTFPAKEAGFQLQVLDRLLASNLGVQGEGLQINFHQNPFDTDLRHWNFILNQGHFSLYFLNRVNWYMAPKNQIVTPFPLHVDIESSSTCNMNCPMCYRKGLKNTGQMDPDLFRKIVDECADEGVYSVRLSWRGETLTHPKIQDMIRYACARIPNVSFLTNAFFLNEDMAECFIEAGVAYVAVSFDGVGKVYEKVRAPAKFEENRAKVGQLKAMREAAKALRPQIRLCTIWPAVKDDPEEYTELMRPVSDYMVCNPYINFSGPMTVKPDFICQYPWERLVIAYNGDTQCCTGWNAWDIILGNVADKSLKEMWLSPEQDRIRETHATGRRLDIGSCAECRHGSKGDDHVSIDQILERRW